MERWRTGRTEGEKEVDNLQKERKKKAEEREGTNKGRKE